MDEPMPTTASLVAAHPGGLDDVGGGGVGVDHAGQLAGEGQGDRGSLLHGDDRAAAAAAARARPRHRSRPGRSRGRPRCAGGSWPCAPLVGTAGLPSLTASGRRPRRSLQAAAAHHAKQHLPRGLGRQLHPLRLRCDAPDGPAAARPDRPAVRELGLFDAEGVEVVGAGAAGRRAARTVHDPDYVAAVRAASLDPAPPTSAAVSAPRTTRRSSGCTRPARGSRGLRRPRQRDLAGRDRARGELLRGLHHAMPATPAASASTTTPASRSSRLLDHGAQQVAYVDVDVHHGDGVERMFWDDPRVLTDLAARERRALFPGTGFPADIGGHAAEGTPVNLALPPDGTRRGCGVPRRCAALWFLRAGRAGHPARLRLPLPGPAGAPGRSPSTPSATSYEARTPWRTRSAAGRWWPSAAAATSRRRRAPGLDAPAPSPRTPGPADTEVPEPWRAMVRERSGARPDPHG